MQTFIEPKNVSSYLQFVTFIFDYSTIIQMFSQVIYRNQKQIVAHSTLRKNIQLQKKLKYLKDESIYIIWFKLLEYIFIDFLPSYVRFQEIVLYFITLFLSFLMFIIYNSYLSDHIIDSFLQPHGVNKTGDQNLVQQTKTNG